MANIDFFIFIFAESSEARAGESREMGMIKPFFQWSLDL